MRIQLVLIAALSLSAPLAAALLPSQAAAQALNPDVVTFEGLKNLIETRQLTSVEAVLPLLPKSYLQNFTMMKQSVSAQAASPLNPRVLLFGESAKSVLSFNSGSLDQRGRDTLEMMEFKTETGKFEFREIKFTNGTVAFSEANPAKCVGCHRGRDKDLRPNWEAYPRWRNAYGSDDDFLNSEERGQLDAFLKIRNDHPRYKHLVMPEGGPYFGPKFGAFIGRPNMRLTTFLTRWNAKKIVAQLKQDPRYTFWRDLLLLESSGDEAAFQRAVGVAKSRELLSANELNEIAQSRTVLDLMSDASRLTSRDWSLEFLVQDQPVQRSSRSSRTSKLSLVYFEGYRTMSAYVLGELWRDAGVEISSKIAFDRHSEIEMSKKYSEGIENYVKILDAIGAAPTFVSQVPSEVPALLEKRLLNR